MTNIANKAVNSVLTSLLVFFVLVSAFFFAYNLRSAGDRYDRVKSMKYEIILKKTLVQSLDHFPVLVIFLFVFSFTVLYTLRSFQSAPFPYNQVAAPSFILLLVFMTLVIASNFLFMPNLRRSLAHLENRAETVKIGARYAGELNGRQDYAGALSVIKVILELDENNKDLVKLRDVIEESLEKIVPPGKPHESEPPEPPRHTSGYYDRAKEEFDQGNYHVALFYLERALKLRKDEQKIKELYERTKKEIERELGALTKKDKETQRMLQQKERGIGHLDKKEYYEAYGIFRALSDRYPGMRDLRLYLGAAEKEIRKQDFLSGELRSLEWLPSRDNIVFIDREGYINTVGRIVSFKGQYYFYDVTRRSLRGGAAGAGFRETPGRVIRFKAGKWVPSENTASKAGGGKIKPAGESAANDTGRIRLKNDEGYLKTASAENEYRFITPYVPPGFLAYSGDLETLKNMMTIFDYLHTSGGLKASGFDVEGRFEYLADRSGIFFSVYVLALVLSAIGWSRRSIHEFPPIGRLAVFFLVMPPLSYFLHHLYLGMNEIIIYTHQYAARGLLKGMNILLFTLIAHLAISVGATVYYLSQRSTME
jgi:tetratricopeptide (TPR) repeat protein